MRTWSVVAAVFAIFCNNVLAAPSAAERVRGFVAQTQSFKASFQQTVLAQGGKKSVQSQGSVVLVRPGKFRWQIDKPYEQLMIGDGQKVWLFDRDLEQVTVRTMAEAMTGTPAALLAGDRAIEQTFTLTDQEARAGQDWVLAMPKSADSSFSRIRLGFKGDVLQTMEMDDHFGQTTTIVFSGIEINPRIGHQTFKFTPPPGVDVVGQ